MLLLRFVVLVFVFSIASTASAASHRDTLAAAQARAAEGSWEQAKSLYTQALASAPDAEARNWCELWIEDASWRSETKTHRGELPHWQESHLARYDIFERAYAEGRARDDFWIAVFTSRADLEDTLDDGNGWKRRVIIADHLAAQPPSPGAAQRFIAFLQQSLRAPSNPSHRNSPLLIRAHLASGVRIGPTADDRAWCEWQLARITDAPERWNIHATELIREQLPAQAAQWSHALAAIRGTRWEAIARADEFIWRVATGWSPGSPRDTPADIPARLEELDTLRTALNAVVATDIPADLGSRLDQIEHSLKTPLLDAQCARRFLPNSPVRFSYGTVSIRQLTFHLDRHDPVTWASLITRGSPNYYRTNKPASANSTGHSVRTWTIDFPDADQHRWHSAIVDAADSLPPGFYALRIDGVPVDSSKPLDWMDKFVVTDLTGVSINTPTAPSELFIFSASTDQPAGDKTVQGSVISESIVMPFSGKTTSLGSFQTPPPHANQETLVAEIDGQPISFSRRSYPLSSAASLIVDIFTDRPLYRPGETAHWKLIARQRQDGRFVVPSLIEPLRLTLTLGREDLLTDFPVVLSPLGTAHGEIAIPASAQPGAVRLKLAQGSGHTDVTTGSAQLFQVDNFVPPAITAAVSLASDATSLRPGGQLVVRASTTYFSGGPVVNAPVVFRFSLEHRYLPPAIREIADTLNQELVNSPQQEITDASGNAECHLTIPSTMPEGLVLQVKISVQPEGIPAVEANREFVVSTVPRMVDAGDWVAPRLAQPGDEITFSAVIRDGERSPVAFIGTAELSELRWTEVWLNSQGQVATASELAEWRLRGERESEGWKNLQRAFAEIKIAELPVKTGADGIVSARFKLPRAGIFRVRFPQATRIIPARVDSASFRFASGFRYFRGTTGEFALSVIAVDEHTESLALPTDFGGVICPLQILPNENLKGLAIVPEGTRHAWLSVSGERETRTEPLPLRGRLASWSLDQLPAFLGEANVTLSAVLNNGLATSYSSSCHVSTAQHKLQISFGSEPSSSRPGTPASIDLHVVDTAGHPLKSELVLGVSDESVNQLVAQKIDPVPLFLGLSVARRIETTGSFGFAIHDLTARGESRYGALLNPSELRGELETLQSFGMAVAEGSFSGSRGTARQLAPDADFTEVSTNPSIQIRRHFSSTATWQPEVITDTTGTAQVSFNYPDNLTRWRIDAYAIGADGDTFGRATTFTQTSLPFQARLNAPRFLITGDSFSASATLVNRIGGELRAEATFAASGAVTALKSAPFAPMASVVPSQGETHVAWHAQAVQPGKAELTLSAHAGDEADAMMLPIPILEDGLQQHTAAFGRLASDAAQTRFSLELPAKLDAARTQVSVHLSPSYAITLLDALPYLIDYPYGCIEQTMNRFLPAVVARKTLVDLGLDAQAVEHRILVGETTADKKRREKSASLDQLDEVVRQSLTRISDAHSYSGYGWWPGAATSDLWMTAYVCYGLSLAQSAGIKVPSQLASESLDSLLRSLNQSNIMDDRVAFAWAALARATAIDRRMRRELPTKRFETLFVAREKLSASGRASLALAAKTFGTPDQIAVLLRNLDNGVQRASAAGLGETVHWGTSHDFWRATDGAVESTALTLLALLELDPKNKLIEPAANWLVLNRRSAHWSSTRDTAFAILALNAYLQQVGQLDAAGEVELLVNSTSVQRVKYSRASLLDTPSTFAIPATALRGGTNTFTLRRIAGSNPVNATAFASSWARGDDVKPAGHLLNVARLFERQKAEPTLVGTLRLTSESLGSSGAARAGEEVTARVTLVVPNELEYVMIEVPKPAGCEPLNPLSGWDARLVRVEKRDRPQTPSQPPTDEGRPLYREERDDRSVFFLDHLEAGTWELHFGLRAVTPGDFRALPVTAEAMYVPEITANSDARRVKIERIP